MANTFKAGTLLVDRKTKLAYLVEQTFTILKGSEFRQLRAVGTLQLKTIKIDMSCLSEDFEIVEADPV